MDEPRTCGGRGPPGRAAAATPDRLQHPLRTTGPDAVDRLLRLWDALADLERRADDGAGPERRAYEDALQELRRAWMT